MNNPIEHPVDVHPVNTDDVVTPPAPALVTELTDQLIAAADNADRTTELLEVWERSDLMVLTAAVQRLARDAANERART